jgi:hypothetical protein
VSASDVVVNTVVDFWMIQNTAVRMKPVIMYAGGKQAVNIEAVAILPHINTLMDSELKIGSQTEKSVKLFCVHWIWVLRRVSALLPGLPFTAPSTIFLAKNEKGKKVKKELIRLQWHGGKIKYAGHYFIAWKKPLRARIVVMHKIMNAPGGQQYGAIMWQLFNLTIRQLIGVKLKLRRHRARACCRIAVFEFAGMLLYFQFLFYFSLFLC